MLIVGERGSGTRIPYATCPTGSHAARGRPSSFCCVANTLDAGAGRALRDGAIMQPRARRFGCAARIDLFAGLIVGQMRGFSRHLSAIAWPWFNLDAAPADGKRNVQTLISGPGNECREL